MNIVDKYFKAQKVERATKLIFLTRLDVDHGFGFDEEHNYYIVSDDDETTQDYVYANTLNMPWNTYKSLASKYDVRIVDECDVIFKREDDAYNFLMDLETYVKSN